ncbi:MAG: hypothetical protein COU63_00425 [Candidatus Pacebacteria bacterium CG10_big_fil_rev_8_21_14_0_10_36_11]|nr:MAG: hypothetical protein AUK08_00020 [Candidatus Pacebacteria bacterium CG2_30_36_39]PIR65122.1 MAG: hypothetical protein COU63_00425 [Candidatus Pacebacteria bacterium CG10_big_fil_rev_8_21_14_0_10_36_11]PJC42677.1 MAG: hypothetical protein CO040_03315 [Candidatus Pacebacteria bacterium CG_4_9_14_0_2_um_filter_36_8]
MTSGSNRSSLSAPVMFNLILSFLLVLIVIFTIPFIIYGSLASFLDLKTPAELSPIAFLLNVLISKIGTAATFVLIFNFTNNSLNGHWLLYAIIWLPLFIFGEISQTIEQNYSWKEAVVGIISEIIYLPISAYIVDLLIKT